MSEPRKRGGGGTDGRPGATAWRDVPCGLVGLDRAGQTVELAGWVHRRRDLGAMVFVQLRDRTGRVQISFGPDWTPDDAMEVARSLSPEDVLQVQGEVTPRPPDAVNPDMATGEVEVRVISARRLASADPLPILVAVPPEEQLPSEELRLRHRVLDLRRAELLRNFEVRHKATAAARAALSGEGFLEVETPFLTRRTPEGARDYLVPSRIHRGEFYALPQSPQLYKQLLMVAGFDRYFQIARCLRDEDLRADRQPEFTQVDVEMSFVDEEDVFEVCERMLQRMFAEATGSELSLPFPRLTYAEALERFGTDKPDLRVPWELRDFTTALSGRGFGIIDSVVAAGGRVRGFVAKGGAALSRRQIDAAEDTARRHGAKGVLWLKRSAGGWSGPPSRFLEGDSGDAVAAEHGVREGDLVLLVAGPDAETSAPLDALRRWIAVELGVSDSTASGWLWVTDFPMFVEDPETGRPVASHHPFTMPREDDPDRILAEPLSIGSRAYDLVWNGTELVSGSIRCHDPRLQRAILAVLGFSPEETESRFGFLLEAFRYGVPPHGGFAMGLDRLVAMMVGSPSIREVIAFPKTTAARGLMEGAPSAVAPEELAELGLRLL